MSTESHEFMEKAQLEDRLKYLFGFAEKHLDNPISPVRYEILPTSPPRIIQSRTRAGIYPSPGVEIEVSVARTEHITGGETNRSIWLSSTHTDGFESVGLDGGEIHYIMRNHDESDSNEGVYLVDGDNSGLRKAVSLVYRAIKGETIDSVVIEGYHLNTDSIATATTLDTQISVEVGSAITQYHGNDTILVDQQKNIYGVFDGVGKRKGAMYSSRLAAQVIQAELGDQLPLGQEHGIEQISRALAKAHDLIVDNEDEYNLRGTTAVVARLAEIDGNPFMQWASIGDSRLYILNADQQLELLTADEGEGHKLYRSLGNLSCYSLRQDGTHRMQPGDTYVLVSDGITGDTEDQAIDDRDFIDSLSIAYTAEQAAKNLVDISKKIDDKSVIVIRV